VPGVNDGWTTGSNTEGVMVCGGMTIAGTIGTTFYGYIVLATIEGSTKTLFTVCIVLIPPPPGQITPNPHNIPNNANIAPINTKGSQHKGPQHPFLVVGSC
jgi:hypothetical protein